MNPRHFILALRAVGAVFHAALVATALVIDNALGAAVNGAFAAMWLVIILTDRKEGPSQ